MELRFAIVLMKKSGKQQRPGLTSYLIAIKGEAIVAEIFLFKPIVILR